MDHQIDTTRTDGFHLVVDYSNGNFQITVTAPDGRIKRAELVAGYEPRWGIDTLDLEAIYGAADRLIEEFTKA